MSEKALQNRIWRGCRKYCTWDHHTGDGCVHWYSHDRERCQTSEGQIRYDDLRGFFEKGNEDFNSPYGNPAVRHLYNLSCLFSVLFRGIWKGGRGATGIQV